MRCAALDRELAALICGLRSARVQQFFDAQGRSVYREFVLLRIQFRAVAEDWAHASRGKRVLPLSLERDELWRAVDGLFLSLERLTDPYEIMERLARVVALAHGEIGLVL